MLPRCCTVGGVCVARGGERVGRTREGGIIADGSGRVFVMGLPFLSLIAAAAGRHKSKAQLIQRLRGKRRQMSVCVGICVVNNESREKGRSGSKEIMEAWSREKGQQAKGVKSVNGSPKSYTHTQSLRHETLLHQSVVFSFAFSLLAYYTHFSLFILLLVCTLRYLPKNKPASSLSFLPQSPSPPLSLSRSLL